MAVITISRELGSGGLEVAARVAKALGYELVDKRTVEAIFRQYGLTRFEAVYDTAPSILDLVNSNNLLIVSMLNEIVEAVAKRGNVVILGRAGFAILGAYADVLHVRVTAPMAQRVERVMARENLADRAATEERLRADDEVHRKYVQFFYNKQWDDTSNFALVLDRGSLSVDDIVERIVASTRALEQQALPEGAAVTAVIQVDPVLADAVARAIASPLPAGTRSDHIHRRA